MDGALVVERREPVDVEKIAVKPVPLGAPLPLWLSWPHAWMAAPRSPSAANAPPVEKIKGEARAARRAAAAVAVVAPRGCALVVERRERLPVERLR